MISKTYEGHTVTLNETTMYFSVSGPVLNQLQFPSFYSAKEAIEEAIKQDAAQKRTALRLSLPILNENGERATFRGIHARTGEPLLKGADQTSTMYADADWIQAQLKQRKALLDDANTIRMALKPYALNLPGRYSHTRYEDKIAAAEKDIKEKSLKAMAVVPRLTVVENEPTPAA